MRRTSVLAMPVKAHFNLGVRVTHILAGKDNEVADAIS